MDSGTIFMIRIITAIILGLLTIAGVWFLPAWGFNTLVVAVVIIGLVEYSRMFFKDLFGLLLTTAAGALIALTMLFCPSPADAVVVVLPGLLFVTVLLFMWHAKELVGSAERLGLVIFGVIYIGLAFPFWGWVHAMHMGREFVLLGLAPACLCDTFAYLVGRSFGKRKLASLVSPNKTLEGFAGALIGSVVGTLLIRWLLLPWLPLKLALIFAVAIWITSPMGDLVESLLKRSAGVKDSGNLIPGHGGALDRLDALIFTGPVVYVFARYVIGI